MRVEVDADQVRALHYTRRLISPGGAATVLGISRQRVLEQVNKVSRCRGFLGWRCPSKRRIFGSDWIMYVDMGRQDPELEGFQGLDPKQWQGQDPQEILREAMKAYAVYVAKRASDES